MENTKHRLATYRMLAQKFKSADWRKWKRNVWETPSNARGPEGEIYSDSIHQYGVSTGDAHNFLGFRAPKGYYTNESQDETVIGAVAKLRCPRGTMYIPVTYYSDSDGAIHYMNDYELAPKGASEEEHDGAACEAARSADEYAYIQAENDWVAYEQEEQERIKQEEQEERLKELETADNSWETR